MVGGSSSWYYRAGAMAAIYHWTFNSRTESRNLNFPYLVLQLSLLNPLKPGFKSRMKKLLEQRRQAMPQLHLSDQQFYCLLRCDLYTYIRWDVWWYLCLYSLTAFLNCNCVCVFQAMYDWTSFTGRIKVSIPLRIKPLPVSGLSYIANKPWC